MRCATSMTRAEQKRLCDDHDDCAQGKISHEDFADSVLSLNVGINREASHRIAQQVLYPILTCFLRLLYTSNKWMVMHRGARQVLRCQGSHARVWFAQIYECARLGTYKWLSEPSVQTYCTCFEKEKFLACSL